MYHSILALSFIGLLNLAAPAKIGDAQRDEDGFLTHAVSSEFQKGPTAITVLLPDRLEKNRRYPVLYVLPVEPGAGTKYGHGLREVKRLDLHNKHGLICVMPTFATWPWYADHPRDPQVRQEAYLLKEVLPFVERQYPAHGRLLLGFSKSGNGAIALLLRHPDVFDKAAAFDAPLTLDQPNRFGAAEVYGNAEHFEQYRIPKLLTTRGKELGKDQRLGLIGHANFTDHHRALHQQLMELKIPHAYHDEKLPKHTWDAGWITPAVEFLTAK